MLEVTWISGPLTAVKSDRPPDLKGNGSLPARVYERRSLNHCHYLRLNNFQRDSLKLVARRSELCHKCVWSKQLNLVVLLVTGIELCHPISVWSVAMCIRTLF